MANLYSLAKNKFYFQFALATLSCKPRYVYNETRAKNRSLETEIYIRKIIMLIENL